MSTLELVRGLDRKRYEPIVAVHERGPLSQYLDDQAIPYVLAPQVPLSKSAGNSVSMVARTLSAAPALVFFLRRHRIGIAHANDLRMNMTWSAACKLAGARFVWHQRSSIRSGRVEAYTWLADALLTISEFCRSGFRPNMRERAQIINNPFSARYSELDKGHQRRALLEELGAPHDTLVVGYLSNFIERKKPLLFIEMAARLRDTFGDKVIFPMIGDIRGDFGDRVRRHLAEHRLEGQCRLLGPRFPAEPLLSGFHALVVPAINEWFGRTLVEAMYCRVPVVAADHGGHREIISHGQTGLLVAPDDVDAFTDAVTRLLRDGDFAAGLAEAAASFALAHYSVEAHVDKIMAIYDSLLPRA